MLDERAITSLTFAAGTPDQDWPWFTFEVFQTMGLLPTHSPAARFPTLRSAAFTCSEL